MALRQESQGLFEAQGILPVYSGLGTQRARQATAWAISQGAKSILNLGSAGSRRFAPGEMVQVDSFVLRDSPAFAGIKVQTLDLGFKSGVCGTGDGVELEPPLACDLMDMEGYAIAEVCQKSGIPFYSYKFISDRSDANTRADWEKSLKFCAQHLWECFQKFQRHLKF